MTTTTSRTCLMTVDRNIVIDRLRYGRRRPEVAADAAMRAIAANAITKLPPNRRHVAFEVYNRGRSPHEVARDLMRAPVRRARCSCLHREVPHDSP